MATNNTSVTPETLITIKISLNDAVKKLKLPLKDLNCTVLPAKLRSCLNIHPESITIFERYSDSVGDYVVLNTDDVPVFKSLVRAAKAKGKLRLKCTVIPPETEQEQGTPQPLIDIPVMEQKQDPAMRNLGSGIFQFRDTFRHLTDEAPVPAAFTTSVSDERRHATLKACQELAFHAREPVALNSNTLATAWTVYCNVCDNSMADAHYHCSICDGGDYDLCESCVAAGKSCPGEDHWLIKRFIKDGRVVTSTTERVIRKTPEIEAKVPGAFHDHKEVKVEGPSVHDKKVLTPVKELELTRTCNNCVDVLPERDFVTCETCDDFDLCLPCHHSNNHGHNPAHRFAKATKNTVLSPVADALLAPGRNLEHNAFCDGCDQKIVGVRHKCLQCPDWDYCNNCIKEASSTHPRHRFAPLYEHLPESQASFVPHFGIYCDGPLCSGKPHQKYIMGVRFKCAVCHDTDFCAQCEALPGSMHNRTHPLIKFTTPVKNVNITTINEDAHGSFRSMGDKLPPPVPHIIAPASLGSVAEKQPEPVKTEPINAPIPIQTVADIAPTEEKIPAVQRTAQPIDGDVVLPRPTLVPATMLNAEYVADTIRDGTIMTPGERFTQVWTLRNVGPFVWPAGCSVRYVGGDNMLDVDSRRPNSVASINKAIESSVVARDVQVGEEIAFSITLKAPVRTGKSISYWRLKAADGTPFGHRLWCDIDVRSRYPSEASMPVLVRNAQPAVAKLPEISPLPAFSPIRSELNTARVRLERLRAKILEGREDNKVLEARANIAAGGLQAPIAAGIFNIPIRGPAPTVPQPPAPIAAPITEMPASNEDEQPEEVVESTSSSQMIFPTLEKESPASSMIASSKGKAAYVENETGDVENVAIPQSPISVAVTNDVEPTEAEPFDEVDICCISDDEYYSEDDGFLTDEEYDVLDASDRETVHEA